MMLKQTKIVASISDLRCEVDFIRDLFNAGMNVVRMNTAHASREGFEKLISKRACGIKPYRYPDGYKRSGSTYYCKRRRSY